MKYHTVSKICVPPSSILYTSNYYLKTVTIACIHTSVLLESRIHILVIRVLTE